MPGPGVNDVGGYLNRYKSRLAHVRAPVLSRDQVTFDLGHARDEETQRLVAARAVSIDPVYDTDTQPEPVASSRKRPAVDKLDAGKLKKLLHRCEGYDDLAGLDGRTLSPALHAGRHNRPPSPTPAETRHLSLPRPAKPLSREPLFLPPKVYEPPEIEIDLTPHQIVALDPIEDDEIISRSRTLTPAASPPLIVADLSSSQMTMSAPAVPLVSLRQPLPYRLPCMADPALAATLPWYFDRLASFDAFPPGERVGADWRVGLPLPVRYLATQPPSPSVIDDDAYGAISDMSISPIEAAVSLPSTAFFIREDTPFALSSPIAVAGEAATSLVSSAGEGGVASSRVSKVGDSSDEAIEDSAPDEAVEASVKAVARKRTAFEMMLHLDSDEE